MTIPKIALLIAVSYLLAAAPRSVWDGIYSADQATRGKAAYQQHCAGCHGDNLDGDGHSDRAEKFDGAVPPLSGDGFKANWNGHPLADLFDKVQKQMPRDNPGSVSAKDSTDILAYMLQFNQFPAGKNDLAPDTDAMGDITFEVIKPK